MSEFESAVGIRKSLGHAIEELLQERQSLLTTFCRLAGVSFEHDELCREELLEPLCQLLIDYSALWQFEVAEALLDQAEQYPRSVKALLHYQPVLRRANETALKFNDALEAATLNQQELDGQLSHLGEALAERMEVEDRIISEL